MCEFEWVSMCESMYVHVYVQVIKCDIKQLSLFDFK